MNTTSFPEMFESILVPAIFLPWADDLIDRAAPSPRERVLDVGCGTGVVARRVRQRYGGNTRITGLDLNPEMVAVARSLAPDIEWRQGNALDLPFANTCFDLVLSQEALQFFSGSDGGRV
jgi:ubiquinone/menaquinone biosynthesis C-methylase UbiE